MTLRPSDYDSNGDIIPSGWKEEKGDLISREALKKIIHSSSLSGNREWLLMDLDEIIDNAPTVKPEVKEIPIANIVFDHDKLKELTDDIVERIKSGEIVLQDEKNEKQEGKWTLTDDEMFVFCPYCHKTDYTRPIDASWKFCPECGAKLE